MKRGRISKVIGKMGVGKESDIYKCLTPEGEVIVLKLARLAVCILGLLTYTKD